MMRYYIQRTRYSRVYVRIIGERERANLSTGDTDAATHTVMLYVDPNFAQRPTFNISVYPHAHWIAPARVASPRLRVRIIYVPLTSNNHVTCHS